MDNSNVNDLFRKIVELASIEVGPQGSEALESTGWDCSKEIREKAKEILGILKAPLHTSEVVEMSSTGVSDCFVVIKNMAQQVLAESGDGTVNSAMNCRKIIAATRRLEELLKPSLSTGVVSGIDPDSAVVDPLVRAESDAFTQQTGASHPGCSEQSDRVEAESSNLDEIVSGGSTETNMQRLERRLHELRQGQDGNHPDIGLTLRSLGELSQQEGDFKKAKEYFNEALTVTRSGSSDKDDHKVAEMLHSLGELSQQTGNLKEGIKFLQESLNMQRSLHGDCDHLGIAATLQKLGDLTAQNGDPKQGIVFLQESLRMQRSLYGDRAHPSIAATLQKLGDLTAQGGDTKQGIQFLQESLRMQRSLHGDRAHPGIAATLQKLGDLNSRSGDLKQAIKFLQESLQVQRSEHGERDHPGIATTLHKLGDLTAQSGDLKQGMQFFQESLRMQRSLHGDCDHLGIAITLHKLGDVAILRGDSKQGIEFLQESLKMQRSLHGDRNHPGVAITLRKLGDVMAQTGDVAQALEKLQKSAEVNRSLYGEKDHPNVADVLHSLGKANQRAGDFEQAEKFLEKSLRMKESLFADKKHPSLKLTSNLVDQVRALAQIANNFKAIKDLASFKDEGLAGLTRDAETMLETTSQIDKIAQEILSKLQKPTSEHAESEDKAQGSVYDIFEQISADAENMRKPDLATNPDLHTTWATACTRMIFASQKAAEILKWMIVIKGYFKRINVSALDLGDMFEDECADTADANPQHDFDFHSFVLSEASLIRQLATKILKVHGAQPAADLETRNPQTIYSKPEVTRAVFFGWSTDICMAIAGQAGFMVAGTHNDTIETACNDIIEQTFEMEDLLLDFIWATKGARKSEQDSIIQTFRKIREIALECESQVDGPGYKETYDIDKVLLETMSIRQLAQKILDQYRAPVGERLKDLEEFEDKISKVFGVIVDAAVEMVLLPGINDSDYLAACREIIHATHGIEELVKPPGLSASKMTLDDETASTASLPDTVESYQVGSSTSSSDTSVASVVRTDSIKVGLADDRSIFAEYVSGRPQDCVAKYLPWTPDGITYYHLWIQRTICLHHVTGTCVKKDTCKWLHPNYLDILEALNRLMRSAPVAEPESAGKEWWPNGYAGRGE